MENRRTFLKVGILGTFSASLAVLGVNPTLTYAADTYYNFKAGELIPTSLLRRCHNIYLEAGRPMKIKWNSRAKWTMMQALTPQTDPRAYIDGRFGKPTPQEESCISRILMTPYEKATSEVTHSGYILHPNITSTRRYWITFTRDWDDFSQAQIKKICLR